MHSTVADMILDKLPKPTPPVSGQLDKSMNCFQKDIIVALACIFLSFLFALLTSSILVWRGGHLFRFLCLFFAKTVYLRPQKLVIMLSATLSIIRPAWGWKACQTDSLFR